MRNLQGDVDLMCRNVGLRVSPVRTTAFGILTHMMLAAQKDEQTVDPALIGPHIEVFHDCQSMLDRGVQQGFAEIGAQLDEKLDEARTRALAEVTTMLTAVKAVVSGHVRPVPAVFAELARKTDADLRPSIGAFLGHLNDFARAGSTRRQSDTRGLVAQTVAEIEKINLSIKMISINASVEAAIAGDAGRGFAVIASEIRNLSTRSKEALDGLKGQFR